MENPIKYSELFAGDLIANLQKDKEAVDALKQSLLSMTNEVKAQAGDLKEVLGAIGSAPKGGGGTSISKTNQDVKGLVAAYKELQTILNLVEEDYNNLVTTEQNWNKFAKLGNEAANAQAGSVQKLKAQLALAKATLESMSNTSGETAKQMDTLREYIKQLSGELSNYNKSLKTNAQTQKEVATTEAQVVSNKERLAKAFSSLSQTLDLSQVDLEKLIVSQKQLATADKQGEAANNSLAGSYNQLAAQYNLIKLALNAMNDEMRNSADVGQKWEAEAKRIYETMKQLQANTGKMTLNVGNYEESFTKAFNGVRKSTQQVLREMPTLANSVEQFFIAISNNVPILVDNLQAAQKETGSWKTALGFMVKSIFNWQTAILVVLTILPKLTKAIKQNTGGFKYLDDELKKSIDTQRLQWDSTTKTTDAIQEQTAKLETMYHISQDLNRSWKERLEAAEAIIKTYPDELEGLSAEAIAAGEATEAINQLVDAQIRQAEAQGYLSTITELSKKKAKLQLAELKQQEELQKAQNEQTAAIHGSAEAFDAYGESGGVAIVTTTHDVDKLNGKLQKTQKNIKAIDDEISRVRDLIPTDGLLAPDDKGGGRKKGVKEDINKDLDYLRQWEDAVVETITQAEEKEVIQTRLQYDRQIEDLQIYLAEQRGLKEEEREISIEGERNIEKTIQLLLEQRFTAELDIQKKYAEQRLQAEEEMRQKGIKIQKDADKAVEEQQAKAFKAEQTRLKWELMANRNTAKATYENKISEKRALLQVEIFYWEDYKKVLLESGNFTLEQLEAVEEKIAALQAERRETKPKTIWQWLGVKLDKNFSDEFGRQIEDMYKQAFGFFQDIMDKRVELAEIAVQAAQKEAEATKQALDYEQQARANGYASNVELARKQYEDSLALEKKALAEKQKLEKQQEIVDSASQASSMAVATANLFKGYSEIPAVGLALAIAATATMWGAFVASKIKAAQVAKQKFANGGVELLQGGSHASGHDISLGYNSDGVERRAEGGEYLAIINKRNSRKYGSMIPDIINSLNDGTFAEKYRNASMDMAQFALNFGDSTDLSNLERGVQDIVAQGKMRTQQIQGGRIEYTRNHKRIIHS